MLRHKSDLRANDKQAFIRYYELTSSHVDISTLDNANRVGGTATVNSWMKFRLIILCWKRFYDQWIVVTNMTQACNRFKLDYKWQLDGKENLENGRATKKKAKQERKTFFVHFLDYIYISIIQFINSVCMHLHIKYLSEIKLN